MIRGKIKNVLVLLWKGEVGGTGKDLEGSKENLGWYVSISENLCHTITFFFIPLENSRMHLNLKDKKIFPIAVITAEPSWGGGGP